MRSFIVELDRQRRLVYDFDAWDRIAERYKPKEGLSFGPAELLNLNLSARDIPFLIYAGVAWQDQEITEGQIKGLLNAKIRDGTMTILGATNIVVEAIYAQAGLKFSESNLDGKGSQESEDKPKKAPAPRPVIPGSRRKEK